jgi:hypothetical protein
VAACVLFGAIARAEAPYGTRERPLEGQRLETLQALAGHLDETVGGAVEGAADEAQRGVDSAARLLSAIRSLAREAGDFRRTVDSYRSAPFDVPARLLELTTRALEVHGRILVARALEHSYADWEATLDVLERMRLLLSGRDVLVPTAHVVAALHGDRLEEFRQLADDVDVSATRAHGAAKRDLGNYRERGRQFLAELHYFAVQSRSLRSRAAAGQVNPQQFGPLVDRLLDEARQADRRMRDARVFTSVWDDSGRTITLLHRMASLVRS